MNAKVRAWVEERLDEAESEHRLVVAHTRCERERLRKAVREGIAWEILPSVFARSGYWCELKVPTQARHRMRALQELHPELVFAGPSAALAHGLSVSNRHLERVWAATNRTTHRRSSPAVRSVMVSHGEVVEREGLRMTSLARTVGDCLRLMDFRSGLAVADSALRAGEMDVDVLADEMRAACWHMSGLQRACGVLRLADPRAESGGESIARATMLELGLAAPDLQRGYQSPIDPMLHYRADFVWGTAGGDIVGELDGNEKYESAELCGDRSIVQVIGEEHRRQSHISACKGVLRVVRFGFSDVTHAEGFLQLLTGCGVPRTFAADDRVVRAGGLLRCR